MATLTRLVLRPEDHGREISLEEFDAADGLSGYKFELIDGRGYVPAAPNTPHEVVWRWLDTSLLTYSHARPDVINFVAARSRVFVPGRAKATCPEPDLAAFHDYPIGDEDFDSWRDVSPVLVVEIMS